jgi:hypothetical protein
MTIPQRSGRLPAMDQEPRPTNPRRVGTAWLDRPIQVAVALYLTPALLVVLVVGGLGLLLLGVARLLTVALRRAAGWPRIPAGPASHLP